MQVAVQPFTWQNCQIIRVVGNLVSVHHSCRHLDRPHKVEVVVAKVVSELLDLASSHRCGVLHDEIVNRQCSSDRGLVSDHVEVEGAISIEGTMLNKTSVNDSTRSGVRVVVIVFLDETGVDFLVNKAVQNLGIVVCLNRLNRSSDGRLLKSDHFFLVAGTAYAISVDSDLLG